MTIIRLCTRTVYWVSFYLWVSHGSSFAMISAQNSSLRGYFRYSYWSLVAPSYECNSTIHTIYLRILCRILRGLLIKWYKFLIFHVRRSLAATFCEHLNTEVWLSWIILDNIENICSNMFWFQLKFWINCITIRDIYRSYMIVNCSSKTSDKTLNLFITFFYSVSF